MRLEIVTGMEIEILDGHHRFLFKRLIWKETWNLTIEVFDLHFDTHLSLIFTGTGCMNEWVCSTDTLYILRVWICISRSLLMLPTYSYTHYSSSAYRLHSNTIRVYLSAYAYTLYWYCLYIHSHTPVKFYISTTLWYCPHIHTLSTDTSYIFIHSLLQFYISTTLWYCGSVHIIYTRILSTYSYTHYCLYTHTPIPVKVYISTTLWYCESVHIYWYVTNECVDVCIHSFSLHL